MIIDGNGIVVSPKENASEILEKAQNLLATEHIVQDKIEAGAMIGELINIDEVFKKTFAYQQRV